MSTLPSGQGDRGGGVEMGARALFTDVSPTVAGLSPAVVTVVDVLIVDARL